MKQTDDETPGSGERTKRTAEQSAADETGMKASWAARKAEMQWAREAQSAQQQYWHQSAASLAEYHKAVAQLADAAWNEAIAGTDTASSDARSSKASPDARAELIADWARRLAGSWQSAQQRTQAAARKLFEDQTRAWFDLQDRYQQAQARYQQAVAESYSSPRFAPSNVFAAGADEGLPTFQPPQWEGWLTSWPTWR